MRDQLRRRFWVETVLALASLILGLVTTVWREWIEFLFHVDPDHGSGSLEWGIVVVLLVAAIVCGLLARVEWRRGQAALA